MSIPDYVLRGLADDAITEIRVAEEERHAAFLKTLPAPVGELIDLAEVEQRLTDAREEMSANQFAMENLRSKADRLSRRNAELRIELNQLHDRRRALEDQ